MNCPRCGSEGREYEVNCPACYGFLGYPNVRAAQKPEEKRELANRLREAEVSATVRGCAKVFSKFRRALRSSQPVMCRSLSQVMVLVSSDNELYASFYNLVGAGARRAESTEVERERLQADDLLFPHYRQHIRFAALSLDGRGATSYGNCSLVLKDLAIRDRTTVFEENTLDSCKKRGFRGPLPPGYRAVWYERDKLAAAKLQPLLAPNMAEKDFAKILLRPSTGESQEGFVEVHIYGTLNRRSIERVVVKEPTHPPDRALWLQIRQLLADPKVGASVETYK